MRGISILNNPNEEVNILVPPCSLIPADFGGRVKITLRMKYLNRGKKSKDDNLEVMEYFRAVSLKTYKGKDILKIALERPTSLTFEQVTLRKAATELELIIKQRYPESYSSEIRKLIGGGGHVLSERERNAVSLSIIIANLQSGVSQSSQL